MDGTEPVVETSIPMFLGRVALVLGKVVQRPFLVCQNHIPVPGALCQDGGGHYLSFGRIALYDRNGSATEIGPLVAIDLCQVYRIPLAQFLICPFHGQQRGLKDVYAVYLPGRGQGHSPGYCLLLDDCLTS